MYKTETYTAVVPVEDYIEGYVDVDTFLECCRVCPNYDKVWSCPSYDFDVLSYWRKYKTLELTAVKIIFDEEHAGKAFTKEEQDKILAQSLRVEKEKLSEMLWEKEKEFPGSISLSAGSCNLCHGNCTRPDENACRFPEKMRYSIESIGGNVGLTLSKLMGIELEWMEEGKLPHYFVLVCGLLK